MTDFEEYELLEKQLEGNGAAAKEEVPLPLPPPPSSPQEPERDKKRDERSRDRGHKRSDRDRSPDRRTRDRSRDRDRDRERSSRDRRRSRSRERRDRRRSRSRERGGRDRDRDRGSRRDRSPKRGREPTPPELRLAREKEKELRELERATRTVFAYNLSVKAGEMEIFQFFSAAGKVLDIRIIMDKASKRSRGAAYIEFAKQEDIFNALALTGQQLMGQAVLVKASEAEKNVAWEAQQAAKAQQSAATSLLAATLGGALPGAPAGPIKLQVAPLPPATTDDELRTLFSPFAMRGALESAVIMRDSAGASIGVGYVQFASQEDGQSALAHWDGRQLGAATLKVSVVPVGTGAALPPPPAPAPAAAPAPAVDLDDIEGDRSLKLNAQSRAALMNRLATSAGLAPAATTIVPPQAAAAAAAAAAAGSAGARLESTLRTEQGKLGPGSPIPTPCLLLKNMFDGSAPGLEAGWQEEVAEDVKDECSNYGAVLHLFLDPASKGHVYVKLSSAEAAAAAHKSLHGRFYAHRQVVAEYQFVAPYNAHFGLA